MKTSETCAEVFAALAVAQGAYEKPKRSGKNGRKVGNVEQKVSTEADIREAIADAFKANGLALIQGFDEERERMVTRIAHKSGEWVETYYPFAVDAGGGKNDAQAIGSGATYARRYGLIGATGIRLHDAEDFDDGKEAAPQHTTPRQQRQPDRGVEQQSQHSEAQQWTEATLAKVKTGDFSYLSGLERSGHYSKLKTEHQGEWKRLDMAVKARREELNGMQGPASNGKMSPPEHLNGEAA